ncbi:protein-L-isoaspartate(D-aspartate) O-methyltransferase [Streptomonospora nanhaiensis]|uniref:Protein-L-isoaspartate O-methyltransferase n=1 Tax=Streptomonospora nanhaiensis TaxID=1323731 RepID=A0ABY6YHI9_9ACTN|nr:rRNA adenine N-6-methyltransferase family protein [Streptomonospora nanhaiensis]WAE71738.1 protein-L-isoaspartate(D-aspartate) O-methyltransferase [Streptomonospora nanhaiensis]
MIPAHRRLVARLAVDGDLSPAWRGAFEAVPRHLFLPDVIDGDGGGLPVDRRDDETRWWEAAYADLPVAARVGGGVGDGRGPGHPVTASPAPSGLARVLDLLQVSPGMRVLEIGTGTGYGAALLSHRLGDDAVTSVEIDFALAESARVSLMAAGFAPLVVSGDGKYGWAARAPFDRVFSCVAVRRVPYAWVAQTQPGGRVLTTWANSFHEGVLVDLEVGAYGTARGPVVGGGHAWVRPAQDPLSLVDTYVRADAEFSVTRTRLGPEEPIRDPHGSFAVGVRMPTVVHRTRFAEDPADPRYTVYLIDPHTWSWASWHIDPEFKEEGYEVRQHGPRRLFHELEAAHELWVEAGRPERTRFGLTVAFDHQLVWLDDPHAVFASSR